MPSDTYVCRVCLEQDPTNYRLVTHKCEATSRHDQSLRVLVYWYEGRLHPIRPMPNKDIPRLFMMCEFGYRCRGHECTYAHSKAEQDAWNKKKFGEHYAGIQIPCTCMS